MSDRAPGNEQYIPTRLDWLTLQLNSQFRNEDLDKGFSLFYNAGLDGKTIDIVVLYKQDMNKETMNQRIDTAKEIISIFKNVPGWEWLECNVVMEEMKNNSGIGLNV